MTSSIMVRIIGLDPGLRHTGWGIIDSNGNNLTHVAHGVVHTRSDDELAIRLSHIHRELIKVIELYEPIEAAVEETFVNKNPSSTLKLGMARGVVLCAPAFAGLKVSEYSANRIKKSVVGVGHAEKEQVAMMVQRLLPKAVNLNGNSIIADAADALATAICHAHYRVVNALIG